jgi:excisionase family DNA binding protein
MSGELVGRFRVVVVIDNDEPERTRTGDGAMIELTVTLTDRQLAEIAERAALLVSADTDTVSPWLNVAEAAERLRCSKDRIYDLIALGKLHPRRDGRRVLLRRDDLDAYIEGRNG